MIVVMEEAASDEQVSKVIEKIVELGFDIYRTTGARYTILGAVGARPIETSDIETLENLPGVQDVIRISGPTVRKLKRPVETPATPPPVYFDHLTIFGVGLIGGSFALAARKAGIAGRITGCGDPEFLQAALAHGVIDGIDEAFARDEISDADLLYLAAPVQAIADFLRTNGRFIKAGALVTDAGSAKRDICRVAREVLPPDVHFVGGHPMAGSHRVGVEFANADLFKNAPYLLIAETADDRPSAGEAGEALRKAIEAIGGRAVWMSAAEHDRAVARISHAPQLLSTALAVVVERQMGRAALGIAGGGFADMTRLARSDWSVWEDIVATNGDEIAAALAEVIEQLLSLREAIGERRFTEVQKLFAAANQFLLEP